MVSATGVGFPSLTIWMPQVSLFAIANCNAPVFTPSRMEHVAATLRADDSERLNRNVGVEKRNACNLGNRHRGEIRHKMAQSRWPPRGGVHGRTRQVAGLIRPTTGCLVIQSRQSNICIRRKLYTTGRLPLNDRMSLGELVIIILGGLLLVVAGIKFTAKFFSDDAKWERRRRRSNTRISAKSNRPMVRFSVKTKPGRRK